METLDNYKVNLKDISTGPATYKWHVGDEVFAILQGREFTRGNLDVTLEVCPRVENYELTFRIRGYVVVPCDRCLEDMNQKIDTESVLKVRLGERFEDDGEWITVPASEHELNVAWYIYEISALQIPIRHVHTDGECLKEFEGNTAEDLTMDSRWNTLKEQMEKILNNNKK